MRLSFPNIPRLGRVIVAMRQVRWRSPLMQVWGLAGGLLVAGIAAHYVRSDDASEKKNRKDAAMILFAGENWGTEWQPGTPFAAVEPVEDPISTEAVEPDLRKMATLAAGRKGWKHLSPPLRQEIATRHRAVRTISICWSGTRGGDVSALELYHDSVLGDGGKLPGDFVVGNGRRSVDGRIEPTSRWLNGSREAPAEIIICLTGEKQSLTAAQSEAVGELIIALEADNGRTTLVGHKPEAPGLLADMD